MKKPLKAGDSFDMQLDFGKAGKIEVEVEIEDQGGD
jgi:copper(I)-binding protein